MILKCTVFFYCSRCAEPAKLKGRKLKQVNPEMICLDSTTGDPSKDPSNPEDPRSIRTKADATTTCHTYLYPEVRMDCSNRGELPHDQHDQICRPQCQAQKILAENEHLICEVFLFI